MRYSKPSLRSNTSIDAPQSITSSANPDVVQLRELELPARYQYHLKPRLERDAFLVARVYDWDQYNLMPGALSLFNGGTYVGEAYLNTQKPDDTLELSLGRDQNMNCGTATSEEQGGQKLFGR
ncbi:MAG: hypothetical protein U5L96_01730 [Owenweeksia sp.]|nr:hypothetical protein [Owenweeksia sp.]